MHKIPASVLCDMLISYQNAGKNTFEVRERNEIAPPRLPLPLLRLMDAPFAAVTHSRSTPTILAAASWKNFEVYNNRPSPT